MIAGVVAAGALLVVMAFPGSKEATASGPRSLLEEVADGGMPLSNDSAATILPPGSASPQAGAAHPLPPLG
ncbi:hypothetical protein, partial [Corallococcus terminator]